jgi:Tol biopolymer transport system component
MLALPIACLAMTTGVALGAPTTELVSLDDNDMQVSSATVQGISGDGDLVVFTSSGKFTGDDTDDSSDIFVRDRSAGETTLESALPAGPQTETDRAAISADGRSVAFATRGTAYPYTPDDVYLHNRTTDQTVKASVRSDGSSSDRASSLGGVSADGRIVAFLSDGNFVSGDKGSDGDVFVRNLATGRTSRVSVRSDESEVQGPGCCIDPAVSATGRFVAFVSSANFAGRDVGGGGGDRDVYVRDRREGTTRRVSIGPGGHELPGVSGRPAISGSGRFIAFQSSCAFSARDTDLNDDVYVKDRRTGRLRLASITSDEAQIAARTVVPGISSDGRFVGFSSQGTYVAGDSGNDTDVFVRDRQTGDTIQASVNADGNDTGYSNIYSFLSRDGSYVAFDSLGPLVPTDVGGRDVYVRGPLF